VPWKISLRDDLDLKSEAVVPCFHAFQLLRFPSERQDYHSCNGLRGRNSAFGSCYLRVAKGSPLTATIIQAHAWISRQRGCWWLGRESQGTIIINCGKPLSIRGAKTWQASSPKMVAPMLSYRLLGRLQMATKRADRRMVDNETEHLTL
jgi:hypothetical protein